jgi:hypothetical protein
VAVPELSRPYWYYRLTLAGTVNYVDRDQALADNILRLEDDYVYLGSAHDRYSGVPHSLRLETVETFNHGLFIFDVFHMPDTPGTWPALWTVAYPWPENDQSWPTGGEIDIMEGVNGYGTNMMTFHTTPNCWLLSASPSNCNEGGANIGCVTRATGKGTFGPSFNAMNGGIQALHQVYLPWSGLKLASRSSNLKGGSCQMILQMEHRIHLVGEHPELK